MKNASESFKEQVKNGVRASEIYLTIGSKRLTSEEIESLEYKAESNKELGTIEIELLRAKVLKSAIPAGSFNTNEQVSVEIEVNGEICELCSLTINLWKKADKSLFVEIEATSSFVYERNVPFIATKENITASAFIKEVMGTIGESCRFNGLDQRLNVAMLSGNQLIDTLKLLAISTQSVIRYRDTLEFIPFKGSTAAESVNYENMLLDTKDGSDKQAEFDKVNIMVYMPNKSDQKEIGKFEKATVPNGSSSFNLGTLKFDKPKLVSVISFDNDVDISEFSISSDKVTLAIRNGKSQTIDVNTKIEGYDLLDNSLTSSEDTTNKIKNVQNIYIQDKDVISSYDTRIYTNPSVEVQYRGNPILEVGDTISIEEIGDVLICEHVLKFDGALSGEIKGVIL